MICAGSYIRIDSIVLYMQDVYPALQPIDRKTESRPKTAIFLPKTARHRTSSHFGHFSSHFGHISSLSVVNIPFSQ